MIITRFLKKDITDMVWCYLKAEKKMRKILDTYYYLLIKQIFWDRCLLYA